MVPWTHLSQPPKGILIGSAIYTQLTRVSTTDHATCNICNNKPHLCTDAGNASNCYRHYAAIKISRPPPCRTPNPSTPVDSIRALMIVWRLGEKIIRTVLCCVVYDSCAQWYAHTCEQFLNLRVGLSLDFIFFVCLFRLSITYFFGST